MKSIRLAIICAILTFIYQSSSAQFLERCTTFDTLKRDISIGSKSLWLEGQSKTTLFDTTYTGLNSIHIKIDSGTASVDTSEFIYYFHNPGQGGLPRYLGLYDALQIKFNHRYRGDSNNFGELHISNSQMKKWQYVFSSDFNEEPQFSHNFRDQHVFVNRGDTVFDSLSVNSDSEGWVQSQFGENLYRVMHEFGPWRSDADTVALRFRWISQNPKKDMGWQIDDLCVSLDFPVGLEDLNDAMPTIYPNPSDDQLFISLANEEDATVQITSVAGQLVHESSFKGSYQISMRKFSGGVYVVTIFSESGKYSERLLVR